jgi:hypothetical protein
VTPTINSKTKKNRKKSREKLQKVPNQGKKRGGSGCFDPLPPFARLSMELRAAYEQDFQSIFPVEK